MRILVHEYVGYAFPIQLSQELAKRGHTVQHVYSASFQSPKGNLNNSSQDVNCPEIIPIHLSKPFQKYSFLKRRFQEVEYGHLVAKQIEKFQPDIVISADTPIEAQASILKKTHQLSAQFVFWLQDVYSVAAYNLLRRKIPIIGNLVGKYYMRLEQRLLKESDKIVLITKDFEDLLDSWNVDLAKSVVIPNWGPLQEIPVGLKKNAWAESHGLADKFCFVYSGTLGMKHNPEILKQLAVHFHNNEDVRVVVVSEGLGANWLKEQKDIHKLDNLIVLDFQPYELLPQILATGDSLMAILEPDAGVFSVPSKILTYMCAQRPLLLAMPLENLAARTVANNQLGLVVSPNDINGFAQYAEQLLQDSELRTKFGQNARHYAESSFDIEKIADKFETIFIQPQSSSHLNSTNEFIASVEEHLQA